MLYKVFAVLLVWLAAHASAVASTKLAMEANAPRNPMPLVLALRGGRKGGGGGGRAGGGGKGGSGGKGGGGAGQGKGGGNSPAGWPSTTGNPSGGGRSNNPPAKDK